MFGQYIGEFAIGDKLAFAWCDRNVTGQGRGYSGDTGSGEDASSGFDPDRYTVYDIETGTKVLDDQTLQQLDATDYDDAIYVPTTPQDVSTGNGFARGKNYLLILKEGTTDDPPKWQGMNFRVSHEDLGSPQVDDADLEGAEVNTLMGRLRTLERNQVEVLFPRLTRALGLLGENQITDAHVYDNAGNITSARVRVYDTKANADAAFTWEDTEGVADPVGAFPTTGELARYTLQAAHLNPRQLRTLLDSVIENTPTDETATNNDTTSVQ